MMSPYRSYGSEQTHSSGDKARCMNNDLTDCHNGALPKSSRTHSRRHTVRQRLNHDEFEEKNRKTACTMTDAAKLDKCDLVLRWTS